MIKQHVWSVVAKNIDLVVFERNVGPVYIRVTHLKVRVKEREWYMYKKIAFCELIICLKASHCREGKCFKGSFRSKQIST